MNQGKEFMKIIAYKCPQCGANLEIEQDRKEVYCSFCGTKLFIDDETRTMRIENNININKTIRYTDDAKIIREKNKLEMKKIEKKSDNMIYIVALVYFVLLFLLMYKTI